MAVGGFEALIADWGKIPEELIPETKKVVARGAWNIKNDWRSAWHNRKMTPRLYLTIGYDVTARTGSVSADIGPDMLQKFRGGPLGGIIEYGTIRNAPEPGGSPALVAESPRFEDALADMMVRFIEGG